MITIDKPLISKKTYEYCLTAWNILKSNYYRWHSKLSVDAERSIARMFYQCVFDSYADRTMFSTFPVRNPGKKIIGMTDDHFMVPQTVAKFVMESPEILNSYDEFESIFIACRKTILVTPEENKLLAKLTRKQPVLTKDKYHHLGIELYHGRVKLPEENQVLPVPKLFDEWEQKFIKNNFRSTVVYTESKPNLDEFF